MKIHFKIILLVCVPILILSGCQKMASDFWNGRWQEEKYKKIAIENSKACDKHLGITDINDYKAKEDEYIQCLRSERDKYLNQ